MAPSTTRKYAPDVEQRSIIVRARKGSGTCIAEDTAAAAAEADFSQVDAALGGPLCLTGT